MAAEGDLSRESSPERGDSHRGGNSKATNFLKEIAAEAKQRGFTPLPSGKVKEALPPTRETATLVDEIPEGTTRRNVTPLDVENMFFTWQSN